MKKKLQIEIVLIPNKEKFIAGEVIQGEVKIKALQDCNFSEIKIYLGWKASKKNNSSLHNEFPTKVSSFEELDRRENLQILSAKGKFKENQVQIYSFSLTIPQEGPFEYAGKYFDLAYFLTVQVKTSFFPVLERLYICVEPSSQKNISYNYGIGLLTDKEVNRLRKLSRWNMFIGFIGFILGGNGIVLVCLKSFQIDKKIGLLIMAGYTVFIFLIWLIIVLRIFLRYCKFQEPVFQVLKHEISFGENISFALVITAKKNLVVKKICISLIHQEKIKPANIYEVDEIVKTEKEYPAKMLLAGETKQILDTISISKDTSYYLDTRFFSVGYFLIAYIDIESCPDIKLWQPIFVVPKGYCCVIKK